MVDQKKTQELIAYAKEKKLILPEEEVKFAYSPYVRGASVTNFVTDKRVIQEIIMLAANDIRIIEYGQIADVKLKLWPLNSSTIIIVSKTPFAKRLFGDLNTIGFDSLSKDDAQQIYDYIKMRMG